jgi:serine protease Do
MIYTRSGGYMGIGFAIPINMARRIMKDLIYEGEVSRGWLGVSIQNLDEDMREAMGIDERRGVLIGDVFAGQPADKAGIRRGDVVVSINGNDVTDVNDLRNAVADIRPGSNVPVTVVRDGKKTTMKVKIAERTGTKTGAPATEEEESESTESNASEKLGVKVGSLTDEIRNRLDLDRGTKGVVVLDIRSGSQAAREGIKEYDVIREVNRKRVSSPKEFERAMRSVKAGDSVLFLLEREGRTFFVAFKVRK